MNAKWNTTITSKGNYPNSGIKLWTIWEWGGRWPGNEAVDDLEMRLWTIWPGCSEPRHEFKHVTATPPYTAVSSASALNISPSFSVEMVVDDLGMRLWDDLGMRIWMTCERGCGRPGNEASVFTKCSSIAHLSISNVLPQQYSLIRARISDEEDLQQMIICTGRVWCAHCALQGTTGSQI